MLKSKATLLRTTCICGEGNGNPLQYSCLTSPLSLKERYTHSPTLLSSPFSIKTPWTEGTCKSVTRVGHDLAIKPAPLVSDKNRHKERSESGPTIHSASPAQHLGVITGLTHISVPHLCLKYTSQPYSRIIFRICLLFSNSNITSRCGRKIHTFSLFWWFRL